MKPHTYHLFIQIHNKELEPYYKKAIETFEKNKDNSYKDAGFDLFIPERISTNDTQNMKTPIKIDHQVSCAVYRQDKDIYNESTGYWQDKNTPLSYYMYPRSSISKTPFRLANSVGIIDSGYRGNLIAKIDNIHPDTDYTIEPFSRMFQICLGTLEPFDSITIVDNLSYTSRGSGGFGSTGN